ncbi:MAG: NAD(+)/NADH kinase [Chloroflexi bacterium]|nr:NAD(+)/NADH kinase [Chloroflexota bacterium]
MSFDNIGIIYHPKNECANQLSLRAEKHLKQKGLNIWRCSAWDTKGILNNIEDTKLLFTCGGDGTILRAAQITYNKDIPITGINLGRIGFMTEINSEDTFKDIDAILEGKGRLDKRALLHTLFHQGGGKESMSFHSLNDVVVSRGEITRIIHIDTFINGEHFINYKADGIIVSTATGSTSYCMAAGGPVLHPNSKETVLLPILPHLCPDYSMVLPASTVILLQLGTNHNATLCIDGHIHHSVKNGDTIEIKPSKYSISFLRLKPKNSFYTTLETKLKGNNTLA